MDSDFTGYTDLKLLGLYSNIMAELRNAVSSFSANNPVADYAEKLAAKGAVSQSDEGGEQGL